MPPTRMYVSLTMQVDYGKRVSKCRDTACKGSIEKGTLRIGKVSHNFFLKDDPDAMMTQYYHYKCAFNALTRTRAGRSVQLWRIRLLD